MIVVQAHVWPRGESPTSEDHLLASFVIVNDGTGHATGPNEGGVGNYDVWEGRPEREFRRDWRHLGRIEGLPRDAAHRDVLICRAFDLWADS